MTQSTTTFFLDIFHKGGHAIATGAEPPVPEQDYRRYAIIVAGDQLSGVITSGNRMPFPSVFKKNGDKVKFNAGDPLTIMVRPDDQMEAIIGCNWRNLVARHPVFVELIKLMNDVSPRRTARAA